MKKSSFIRFMVLGLVVCAALIIIAVNTRASLNGATREDCTQQQKCEGTAAPSEFILESFTRSILSK